MTEIEQKGNGNHAGEDSGEDSKQTCSEVAELYARALDREEKLKRKVELYDFLNKIKGYFKNLFVFTRAFLLIVVIFFLLLTISIWFAIETNNKLNSKLFSLDSNSKFSVIASFFNNFPLGKEVFGKSKKFLPKHISVKNNEDKSIKFQITASNLEENGSFIINEINSYSLQIHPLPREGIPNLLKTSIPFILFSIILFLSIVGFVNSIYSRDKSPIGILSGAIGTVIAIFTFTFYINLALFKAIGVASPSVPVMSFKDDREQNQKASKLSNIEHGEYILDSYQKEKLNQILKNINTILPFCKPVPNALLIEGHTDGVWISNRTKTYSPSHDVDREIQKYYSGIDVPSNIKPNSNIELGFLRAFAVMKYLRENNQNSQIKNIFVSSFSCLKPPINIEKACEDCPFPEETSPEMIEAGTPESRRVLVRLIRYDAEHPDQYEIPKIKIEL